MKMKTAAALLSLGLAGSAFAQDHAPLPAQCIADYAVWKTQKRAELDLLPFHKLNEREVELYQCAAEKAYSSELEDYLPLSLMYTALLKARLENYVHRHHEFRQFLDEDAAGKRGTE